MICQLSVLVTEAKWRQWQPEDFHRCLDLVIERDICVTIHPGWD